MGYSTTIINAGEARLQAIQALLQSKLSDLNAAFSVAPAPGLGVALTGSCVHISDPETLPDVTTQPVWFCVVGGGRQESLDFTTRYEFIGKTTTSGFHNVYLTHIFGYVHPDALGQNTDPFDQAEKRERLRERMSDWLRADCFNTPTGQDIVLVSQEFASGSDFDHLTRCVAKEGRKGFFYKSFGGTQGVYGLHVTVEGEIV